MTTDADADAVTLSHVVAFRRPFDAQRASRISGAPVTEVYSHEDGHHWYVVDTASELPVVDTATELPDE